jgi:hypothetical protein
MKNATANIKAALLLLHVDRSKKLERRFLTIYIFSSLQWAAAWKMIRSATQIFAPWERFIAI